MTGRVLYESSNGDSWLLVRHPGVWIADGGTPAECELWRTKSSTEIGQFLRVGDNGPQQQALLELIGTLIDR
jgi:hypothetical protein